MWVSLNSITIQAGDRRLFENTSWTIQKGQDWAVLGPTGAGKSTLVKAIAQKLRLANGEILYYFDETQPPTARPFLHRNEILVLSTETHRDFLRRFAPYHQARWQSIEGGSSFRVEDLLASSRQSPPDGTVQQQEKELIRLLNLDPVLKREILYLSHGESRKVQIACLLLRSPKLLILDDPLVGLDLASRAVLIQSIEELIRSRAVQILWIGSRLEEIPSNIQHFAWVEDNKIVPLSTAPSRSYQPRFDPGERKEDLLDINVQLKRYAQTLENNPVLDLPEMVRLEEVTVRYGDATILDRVHWVVKPGERWALLGPNGAGKTTLLSLILADNPQSYSHSIELFGKRRGSGESIWDIKKNIGWVSPELHIHYPQTVSCLDVVCSGFFDSIGLYHRSSPLQVTLALNWLAALGLATSAARPFLSLSTGQQRLVLLARALVKSPPLLILDEPCQGLDESAERNFVDFLDHLCAQTRVTLIYVTHYLDEIPSTMTHQLVLDQGKVIRNGLILRQE